MEIHGRTLTNKAKKKTQFGKEKKKERKIVSITDQQGDRNKISVLTNSNLQIIDKEYDCFTTEYTSSPTIQSSNNSIAIGIAKSSYTDSGTVDRELFIPYSFGGLSTIDIRKHTVKELQL